jgi:hypothetical protein
MAGLVCTTPLSPVTQVYNSHLDELEPDRTLSPTVIHPDVVAHAKDGSWKHPRANAYLANMVWKVNGVDITTLSEWENKFTIETATGVTRGDITIYKNINPGSHVELSFEAELADDRLGVNIPIKCDPITLITEDSSDDEYNISIGDDQIIQYDPFKDKLHLYEYKVAHGLTTDSEVNRNASIDENCYERTIPVTVFKGKEILPTTEYTLELCRIDSVSPVLMLTALTPSSDEEVIAVTKTYITLDLRLIEKRDYLIRVYKGTTRLAQYQFSVNRVYPKFDIRPTNGTSISPNDKERYDVAMVDCDGNTVDCPESIIKILWKTDTAALTAVEHGEGGEIVFQLSKTGIGNTYLNNWIDVYCEGNQKEVMSVARDELSNELTDENGDTLIFN